MKPTLALLMFGMNDVWRDAYIPMPTEEMLTGRSQALERFLVSMDALVERLLNDRIRVVLLTPTPFDQYAPERPAANFLGADDALAICAGMIRGMAVARRLPVVDLHTPLRRRCAAQAQLVSDDRIHPNDLGHAAMAQLVIAALLPGEPVSVPPALLAASRALHEAECRQRIIAMFRCWADGMEGSSTDDAIRRFIDQNQEKEQNPWTREQMLICRELLPRQTELAAEVNALRQRLTEWQSPMVKL